MAARLTTYVVVAIVAATLIAGLIVGAQREDSDGPVDLIVHNAAVFTADGSGTITEAVAVRGNQILRVGAEREIMRLRRPQTTVIDAEGGSVLPAFNDAHVHLIGGGLGLDDVDLLGATTVDEIRGRIRSWADAHPDRPWVLGRGWYYTPFSGGLPTRQVLDAIERDRPARLISYDGHTAWVNSAALERAGITRATPNPANGVIVKDARTGEPTGVLKESAIALVDRLVPTPSREERARALRSAIAEANAYGITSLQNAGGNMEDLEIYDEARRAGDLDARIYAALSIGPELTDEARARLAEAAKRYPDDPLLKTGAVKIAVDGVIEAHTAAMLSPYANRETPGAPRIDPDALNRLVRLVDAEGWQIMTHAIGDGAVRMTLDAYQHAARSNARPARGRRHRIEHSETVDPADLPRFGSLGVLASMQPLHGSPSPAQIDVWTRNIGPERASRGWPYRSIGRAGGKLAFGSDWPVVSLNPLLGIHTAVNRTTPDGTPVGGWHPAQRLTVEAAIEAYTSGGAWASFDEGRKGTIAPGMLADLVVLSWDILEAPPSALATARVEYTIFDGRIVYRRDRGTN